jgi:hypothetical protein
MSGRITGPYSDCFAPRPVDRKELGERARQEGFASIGPEPRAYQEVTAERRAVLQAAKRYAPK